MAISMNTRADWTTTANSFHKGIGGTFGDLLVGDKAIEFYNRRNPEDYIQISWDAVERVRVQMYFKDRYIHGFFVDTKQSGSFYFVVKQAGKTLKSMRHYLGNEQIVRHVPPLSWRRLKAWWTRRG